MSGTESAVLVAVPQAQAVVGPHRARLDRSAAWGVPPHVTVVYPFVAPDELDTPLLDDLAEAVAGVAAFDVSFVRLRWFGEEVLWLAPEPDQPLVALTAAVWRRFPRTPPYGGAHAEVVPHLTIAAGAPVAAMREAAGAIEPFLPVRARITSVHLMVGAPEPGAWHTVAEFPLGGAA